MVAASRCRSSSSHTITTVQPRTVATQQPTASSPQLQPPRQASCSRQPTSHISSLNNQSPPVAHRAHHLSQPQIATARSLIVAPWRRHCRVQSLWSRHLHQLLSKLYHNSLTARPTVHHLPHQLCHSVTAVKTHVASITHSSFHWLPWHLTYLCKRKDT